MSHTWQKIRSITGFRATVVHATDGLVMSVMVILALCVSVCVCPNLNFDQHIFESLHSLCINKYDLSNYFFYISLCVYMNRYKRKRKEISHFKNVSSCMYIFVWILLCINKCYKICFELASRKLSYTWYEKRSLFSVVVIFLSPLKIYLYRR